MVRSSFLYYTLIPLETFYKIGSTHPCRVIDVRYAERSLVVATKKDILKQKMVSYKVV